MQHVSSLASLSPAAAKKAALAAFDAAVINPHGADWQAVAYGLHAAMTAKRAAKAEAPADDGFLPWYDPEREAYKALTTTRPLIDFAFSDGITVSAPAYQRDGKPINIGKACRVAFAYYRAKTRADAVPLVAAVTYRATGETWNPETINAATEAARATVNLVPVFPVIDKTEAMMRRHAVAARNRVLSVIGDPVADVSSRRDMAETLRGIMKREPLAYPCDADCEAALADPAALLRHEAEWRLVPLIASEVTHPSQSEVARPSDAPPAPVEVVKATPCDAPSPAPVQPIEDKPARHMEAVALIGEDIAAETCPVILGITGRHALPFRVHRTGQAGDAFSAMPEPAAIHAPSDAPSRVSRLRLGALNSTAGVPLAAPVALRRDVSIRLAA